MLIETTININNKILQRVLNASGRLECPRRTIISWLLARLSEDSGMSPVSWSRIRYQERDAAKNWEDSHLYLTPVEYELFLDLKKVYKMSGSYLISYAINKYISELIKKNLEIADNYRFANYGLSCLVVKNIICWIQYWGIPPQLIGQHQHHP
jgi:hypothetical protein